MYWKSKAQAINQNPIETTVLFGHYARGEYPKIKDTDLTVNRVTIKDISLSGYRIQLHKQESTKTEEHDKNQNKQYCGFHSHRCESCLTKSQATFNHGHNFGDKNPDQTPNIL